KNHHRRPGLQCWPAADALHGAQGAAFQTADTARAAGCVRCDAATACDRLVNVRSFSTSSLSDQPINCLAKLQWIVFFLRADAMKRHARVAQHPVLKLIA